MTTPDPAPAASPRPARGFVRSLVGWTLSALLVAIVAGIAFVPWIVGTSERVTDLVATAVPELRADVKPGRVSVGWFGPIVLEDLKVVPHAGGKPPITIKRIEVSHGLGGILLTLGDLGRLRVEGLEADVEFDRDHRSNLDAILPPEPEGPVAAKPRGGPRRAAVRVRLEVDNAIVRVGGPWTSKPWVSDPINIRATLANNAAGLGEWTLEPVQLLKHAELEQTVAQEVLAYIVPVLAESTRTSGRFSLRIDGARLPVGQPAAGELSGMLSMHEVVLGPGPLVENVFRSLPANLPPPPTIRIADESNIEFQLAEGRVWHDGLEFGVPLAKPGQRLDVQSQGSVGLEDRSLDLTLTLPIPADLPQDRPLVAALAGKQISIGVGGELGKPEVKFDGSIKAAAGQVLVDFLDRLRDGPRPTAPDTAIPQSEPTPSGPPQPGWKPPDAVSQGAAPRDAAAAPQASGTSSPRENVEEMAGDAAAKAGAEPGTAEVIVDIVGGVLDEVARRRAERRAAEAANPGQTPPPRRGRLLQRRPPPPPPETPPAPAPAPAP
jgi:hypothetical protein